MKKVIKRISPFDKTIRIPPDKSITHRGIILAALATGTTTLSNPLICKDTLSTLNCIKELGADYEIKDNMIEITSPGYGNLKQSDKPLDAGNSGTTLRLLSGVLASLPFKSVITGDESLRKRPMKRIIEPLEAMGAKIESDNDHPPLKINGTELNSIEYHQDIPSAQVKSAIILAALNATGTTTIYEKIRTRDHTERMLPFFGGYIIGEKDYQSLTMQVKGRENLAGCKIDIPGDFSSAAFFIGLTLLVPGSKIKIENVVLNPARIGMLKIFEGSDLLKLSNFKIVSGEPRGDISIHAGSLKPFVIEKEEIPSLIDEIPILSVIATQLDGESTIKGAGELRVKESDRIGAIYENLNQMSGEIKIKDNDDIIIKGSMNLTGTKINSFGDHRICMAFTVAGMIADGETILTDSGCVDHSFPGFFDMVESLT